MVDVSTGATGTTVWLQVQCFRRRIESLIPTIHVFSAIPARPCSSLVVCPAVLVAPLSQRFPRGAVFCLASWDTETCRRAPPRHWRAQLQHKRRRHIRLRLNIHRTCRQESTQILVIHSFISDMCYFGHCFTRHVSAGKPVTKASLQQPLTISLVKSVSIQQ